MYVSGPNQMCTPSICAAACKIVAEQKKLALGASTIYNVILAERDLVTSQSSLVTAESAYTKARVELDRATGQILTNNHVSLDEAYKGSVSRAPSQIPSTK